MAHTLACVSPTSTLTCYNFINVNVLRGSIGEHRGLSRIITHLTLEERKGFQQEKNKDTSIIR
jgi:hypothetical protein